jgi:hypothetical protein
MDKVIDALMQDHADATFEQQLRAALKVLSRA